MTVLNDCRSFWEVQMTGLEAVLGAVDENGVGMIYGAVEIRLT